MEPWIPLGDWRWPVIGLLGFAPWVLGYAWRWARARGWVGQQDEPTEEPIADRQDTIRTIRKLQQHLRNWPPKGYPQTFSQAMSAMVLAEKLTASGLHPVRGEYAEQFDEQGKRTTSFAPDEWRAYLDIILPYVEEFGVQRALEETQRMHTESTP